jgi:hypothetical protein
MTQQTRAKLLVYLLRIAGIILCLAVFAIFLPPAWMAAGHRLLGLGEFPDAPIVDYLARSVSILYAVHGGALLLLSTDIRRFAPLIRYFAIMDLVFGTLMIGIDLFAGLPLFWTLQEGPPVMLKGVLTLYLLNGLEE